VGEAIPALPAALSAPTGPDAPTNRRTASCQPGRAYPWLLVLSTAIAGLFCLLYITKPVIVSSPAPAGTRILPSQTNQTSQSKPTAMPNTAATRVSLLPDATHLPGERVPASTAGQKPADSSHPPPPPIFEETNLRIQHILTAEAPGGHLARMDLDVPVLYQSRALRWTPATVTAARALLARFMDYQEKSRQLRAEGGELLDAWNRLISHSLPTTELRADSPSLPANQEDNRRAPHPAGFNTTESIQIQPTGK